MKISRLFIIFFNLFLIGCSQKEMIQRPNIILIMTDDQGWGQTGYYNHPLLKTPNLDEMANNGLRFDRFYAGAPVCSPTRASVLTGRSNDRTGDIFCFLPRPPLSLLNHKMVLLEIPISLRPFLKSPKLLSNATNSP